MSDATAAASNIKKRVLVLDGDTRAALAVVRSLGRAGYDVSVAAAGVRPLAFVSTWANLTLEYPAPDVYPDRFVHWLSRTIELLQPHCVVPVSDLSLGLVLEYEDSFRSTTILPTISKNVFAAVSDKAELANQAQALGIATPKTSIVSTESLSQELLAELLADFQFPVVIKPRRSVQRVGASTIKADVQYAHSMEQLYAVLSQEAQRYPVAVEYLLQECIEGQGVGVFALCVKGEVLMSFAHQRLLEKPPSGGRSVLSESLAPDEAPMKEAFALLQHYRWDGVAMVEFKRTAQGRCWLMEINPRFWGSLQLAVDSGRDFPKHLLALACRPAGVDPFLTEVPAEYLLNQRLRWLLGTLDHALIKLRRAPCKAFAEIFLRNALLLRDGKKQTRFEICRRSDIRPFMRECRNYVSSLMPWN